MNDSSFVEFEPCPFCHIPGRKKTYARYDDGHAHCFWCHRGERAKRFKGISERKINEDQAGEGLHLPYDCVDNLTPVSANWLHGYGITMDEVRANKVCYSTSYARLIFPYYSNVGELVGWQGRYFGDDPKRGKWFSQGRLDEIHHVIGEKNDRSIVLVEDVISAIKVGRHSDCMVLFGTSIPGWKLVRLRLLYDSVTFWLDNDAAKKAAQAYGLALVIGLNAKMIITDKDPKEYNDEQIKDFLK